MLLHMSRPVDPLADPHAHLSAETLRRGDSIKWRQHPEGVIPLWIADMDFPVAAPVLDAVRARLDSAIGYPVSDAPELKAAIARHLARSGLSGLRAGNIALTPSVVPGIYASVNALSAPGEAVVLLTPVYHPFHMAITELGRRPLGVPLLDTPEGYRVDWEALEAACAQSRLLLLCHPHNPTGRVWTPEELERLRDLAVKYDLFVMSDELHADLRYEGRAFESFAADPRVQARTVTVTGPCKAFNTAGLGIGAMISHDADLVARVRGAAGGLMGHPAALSLTMWQAALDHGQPWLEETVAYLQGNRDFISNYLREKLPWVRFHPVESTYLAWLDLRAHPRAADMHAFLLQEAQVALNDGPMFAPEAQKPLYQGFVRLNFATSRALLTEALERMRVALAHP